MSIVVIQAVNYTLSFLMWMIVGRAILRRMIGDRRNVMLLAFVKVTEPCYALTRRLLPFVGEGWVPFATFVLIGALRLAMIVVLHPATR